MPHGDNWQRIILPWPPSINHYWRRNGNRYFISKEGTKYRNDVNFLCQEMRGQFSDTARLSVSIEAYPPDRRRRDLDNTLKALLDSLQHADVFKDDNQIDALFIRRNASLLSQVVVDISEI